MEQDQNIHSGVIWITGYSAAGKTTVGRKIEMRLRNRGLRTIFLDGDNLRSIFANRWGYSREDRIDLAKVYFRLCSHLSSQGFTVIIAAVAMYDEVREWIHENISNAIEAYLSVPDDIRRDRDGKTKKIYTNEMRVEDLYDAPKRPDIVATNHGDVTADAAAETIIAFFLGDRERRSDKGRQSHWNSYYATSEAPVDASPFAVQVNGALPSQSTLLEVGCGNGRDAAFFCRSGHRITAIDLSSAAIESCRKKFAATGIEFYCGTMSAVEALRPDSFHAIYSRFCLHAMTFDEENEFLLQSNRVLKESGQLFIECRSINDPMARKGEVLSPTERIHGHYRRFIVLDDLKSKLAATGFKLVEASESSGLAVLGDDDPVVIRIQARKS
jgi:bifunctional enzyme CysN/CysC